VLCLSFFTFGELKMHNYGIFENAKGNSMKKLLIFKVEFLEKLIDVA
jgi:hypothetical protein